MQILIGLLAAFGLLCALWCVLSLRPSGGCGWTVVCYRGKTQTAALRRCRWLRSWGLYRGPILLVSLETMEQQPQISSREAEDIEFCTLAALPARLELELEDARHADFTRHRSSGSISKL